MLTRRDFMGKFLGGVAAAAASSNLWPAERPAWAGPIGLEVYTVRELIAKDLAGTLKQVAAVGYREIEISPEIPPQNLKAALHGTGLSVPSCYFETPETSDDWKKSLEQAHA